MKVMTINSLAGLGDGTPSSSGGSGGLGPGGLVFAFVAMGLVVASVWGSNKPERERRELRRTRK